MAAIRASLTDERFSGRVVRRHVRRFPPEHFRPIPLRDSMMGFDGNCLHLDTACFDVSNVAEAVRLCMKVLGGSAACLARLEETQGGTSRETTRPSWRRERRN